MALPLLVRAALTVAFSASGAVHLWRCLAGTPRRPGGVELVNDAVHLLMSVEMVAMAWRAPLRDRWSLQLTVFAVATGWFLVQAIAPLPVRSMVSGAMDVPDLRCRAWPARHSSCAPGARAACLQHAIMAAVMTWMIAVMPAADGITAMPFAEPATVRTAGQMAGMAMSTASVAADGAARRHTGAWLGGYLLLTASSWLVVAYRAGRRHRVATTPGGRPVWARLPGDRSTWATRLVAVEAMSGAISYAVIAAGMGAVLLAARILAPP